MNTYTFPAITTKRSRGRNGTGIYTARCLSHRVQLQKDHALSDAANHMRAATELLRTSGLDARYPLDTWVCGEIDSATRAFVSTDSAPLLPTD